LSSGTDSPQKSIDAGNGGTLHWYCGRPSLLISTGIADGSVLRKAIPVTMSIPISNPEEKYIIERVMGFME
jgi:hypothetical protein